MPLYVTRRDAEQAARDAIFNVAFPASQTLVKRLANRCWDCQETPAEALAALAASGVDCEGFAEPLPGLMPPQPRDE